MTNLEFDSLVARLEVYAQKHPNIYRARVALLGAFGYAFVILLPVLASAAAIGFLIAVFSGYWGLLIIAVPLVLFAFTAIKALWVRIDPPEGVVVSSADAPALFEVIESVRTQLKCRRIHHVILDDRFNASIVQVPRLGVLGWQRNYLVLGMPLVQGMSPEHFRAVIGHELGHLSRADGKFSQWVYRIEKTWAQVLQAFEKKKGFGARIYRKFFRKYSPYFAAYSFVTRRSREYVADEASAIVTSAQCAASALLATSLQSQRADEFFEKLYLIQTQTSTTPPTDVLKQLALHLQQPMEMERMTKELRTVRQRITGNADTHPSMGSRISALGFAPSSDEKIWPEQIIPAVASPFASEVFLKALPERFEKDVYQLLYKRGISRWVQRYNYLQKALPELEKYDALIEKRKLKEEEAWQRLSLINEIKGGLEATPAAREFLESWPDHARANYLLGQALLKENDKSGIEFVTRAMKRDPDAIPPACQLLYGYYMRAGDLTSARLYLRQGDEHSKNLMAALQERNILRLTDVAVRHEWGIEKVQPIVDQLKLHKRVKRAYLFRKEVRHFPQIPCHILIIEPKGFAMKINNRTRPFAKLQRQLAQTVRSADPLQILVLERGTKLLYRFAYNSAVTEIYAATR